MAVVIRKADYERMLEHARTGVPFEACGLIAGRVEGVDRLVERVFPLENPDQSAEHFTIDPRQQLAAVKEMRALGLAPLGNFHSHPATPARPSEEDIRLAHDPKAAYLILSLAGEAPVLRAFEIRGGEAAALEVRIV
ncbi:MAG: M67 family metallopeptidase [Clostridiales Family XIII bacterium]|jgi:proteasome lid subunit RPN8/RPN11|nr:M67 family metallopeptidase [Clostridiales Family XIII bacterium]